MQLRGCVEAIVMDFLWVVPWMAWGVDRTSFAIVVLSFCVVLTLSPTDGQLFLLEA